MEALSDDDFERVSDIDLSDSESDEDRANHETPSSTPPSIRRMRASDRKTIACTYPNCPKTFNRKARLEEHLRSHTNSRIFKCKYEGCDKDFLRETHLKHHVKSAHSNVRDYKCSWEGCDKSFATGTRLRRHFQAHEGREKYRCRGYPGCDQTFRKHETLRRHILQVHEQMRPFPCDHINITNGQQCDKAFDTAEKLRVHQRAKHDNTRFSCTECLSVQAQTADSISALATQHFNAFFATYSDLQMHIAEFHPPTCPHCPTSFTTAKELTRHLEIQHGIFDQNTPKSESFKCEFVGCGRSFTKRGNLNVHVKTVHEKKKDFVCGETVLTLPMELFDADNAEVHGCGRSFTTKASLEDHVRSAHLGRTSLQVERRNKRKAENQERLDDSAFEPKARKSRKDKGAKKISALHDLTGAPVGSQQTLPLDPALANPYADAQILSNPIQGSAYDEVKVESSDEDDFNQLSGSMIMLDDRLYHYDEQYEYDSNQHLREADALFTKEDYSPNFSATACYSKVSSGTASSRDHEPFFAGFEHEPEPLSS